ncbi:hypothetical protein IQ266_11240 [filamentous cyanobacterium LEGE 11480]|uniref:Uncharacterized protein n=1 Tax=Romeriopsis navalis LEGE 11480 TaxID=2777977 RepID=A0A928VKM7_9CYAN|nr:hypothetical protein [Romeriopsis navalis]MBE9030306.1 hypothetical protein [Romeriopsis navalis LEGE 11480]
MVRLNQAALDLLQVELRRRTRSAYQQVGFSDALESLDASSAVATVSPAEAADIANELVAHRLKRLHDSQGNPVTYIQLRQSVVDLIPGFPDTVLRRAAKLNRPRLAEVPLVSPSLPLVQWSNLVLGVMVGGVGVLAMPFLRTSVQTNWARVGQNLNFPMFSTPAIAEVEASRSLDLIATAKTFAAIVQQRMRATALSTQEWHSVVSQWQEAIDLLQQVPSDDAVYADAQQLMQQYQQQQSQAQQRLKQEQQSRAALKSANGRSAWLLKRLKTMNGKQKAAALNQVEQQLKPVVPGTTSYADAKVLRDRLKQQFK